MDIFFLALCFLSLATTSSAVEEVAEDNTITEPVLLIPHLVTNCYGAFSQKKGKRKLRLISLRGFSKGHSSSPGKRRDAQRRSVAPRRYRRLRLMSNPPQQRYSLSPEIGLDTEDSFAVLKPVDRASGSNGFFPCSQSDEGFEHVEIVIPEDLSCESCTLQLILKTEDETQYYCSDVMVFNEVLHNCMGGCENGGTCVNGVCACPEKFDGEHCELQRTEKSKGSLRVEKSHVSKWWIALLFLPLLLAAVVVGCIYMKKKWDKAAFNGQALTREMGASDKRAIGTPFEELHQENQRNPWKNEKRISVPEEQENNADNQGQPSGPGLGVDDYNARAGRASESGSKDNQARASEPREHAEEAKKASRSGGSAQLENSRQDEASKSGIEGLHGAMVDNFLDDSGNSDKGNQ